MFDKLFGRRGARRPSNPEPRFGFSPGRAMVGELEKCRNSGQVPKQPMLRMYTAFLRTRSKKEALKVARAWPFLVDPDVEYMVRDLVIGARETGHETLARDLEKRLRWVRGLKLDALTPMPADENPVFQVAMEALKRELPIEIARQEILKEEHLLMMSEMSIEDITQGAIAALDDRPLSRIMAYYLAELNWAVADYFDSNKNKASCAEMLAKCILTLPDSTPAMRMRAMTLRRTAVDLWREQGEEERAVEVAETLQDTVRTDPRSWLLNVVNTNNLPASRQELLDRFMTDLDMYDQQFLDDLTVAASGLRLQLGPDNQQWPMPDKDYNYGLGPAFQDIQDIVAGILSDKEAGRSPTEIRAHIDSMLDKLAYYLLVAMQGHSHGVFG